MKSSTCQGKLIKWKDDRGFGFIKSDGEDKEIFLHISALNGASRRPKVGDTIFYEKAVGKDGKLSAVKASIQGVSSRNISKKQYKSVPKSSKSTLQILSSVFGLVAFVGVGTSVGRNFFNFSVAKPPVAKPSVAPSPKVANSSVAKPKVATPSKIVSPQVAKPQVATAAPPKIANPPANESNVSTGCNIKGNISVSSGKKFYHLAGMPEYEITEIDISRGERYFCSESEAIANGWRKAPR